MPCNDCSRAEKCPPCPYDECKCHHAREHHKNGSCVKCVAAGFDILSNHAFIEPEEPKGSASSSSECRFVKANMSHCFAHTDSRCCDCNALDPRAEPEPPMTPEEEEQAPEDEGDDCVYPECTCGETACESKPPEYRPCACGHIGPEHWPDGSVCMKWPCACLLYRPEEPPSQPDRRPPLLVAYSVQGHLYEVALPGDAVVRAVDGALVITHALGPVNGIVQCAPMQKEGA